ncbi:MAG: hypothetical protein IKL55_07240 [Clostridia bacterium]|nr:hypothetical protein [Clostridia bacterium]
MKRTSKIIIAIIIVAVLLLGIGYAAIQNITLTIAGTAAADPSQSNFKVMFSGTPTVSDDTYVTAAVTDDTNATINVEGLTKKGDVVSATYTVQNASTDLSADLSVATTNNNTEYFTLSSELEKTSLVAGEATTLTVTVELTKTPITDSVSATIGVQLTAMPVQPGEEGTSEGINGSSQTPEVIKTTLSTLTNENIGDYIDLGNNVVGTARSSDDWRIYYKDENTVYVVLADYLPNSTNYAVNAGLETMGTYGVYSNTNRDTLLTALTTNSNWNDLANGVSGATVTGAATAELSIYSYYAKTGILLDPTNNVKLDSNIEGYDIYVPQTSVVDDCKGTWMASSENSDDTAYIYCIFYTGATLCEGFDNPYFAIRPVIALPASTVVIQDGDTWTIPIEATNGKTTAGVERNNAPETINTTLASVTNANIGEYIDLGNNIVGGKSTSDDWRILYKDGDTTYAILADYLPNSTGNATAAGLDISKSDTEDYEYAVYSKTNRDTLLAGLTHSTVWNDLANGLSGATVTGAPTAELLMRSYNTKNGTDVDYTTYPDLGASYLYAAQFDPDRYEGTYWLASPRGDSISLYGVHAFGHVHYYNYDHTNNGVRPVVALPSELTCSYTNGVWVVD